MKATQDYAANLALFLTEKTRTPLGEWKGRVQCNYQKRYSVPHYVHEDMVCLDNELPLIFLRLGEWSRNHPYIASMAFNLTIILVVNYTAHIPS